jgi:hypothetical protein
MIESTIVYTGLTLAAAGLLFALGPMRRLLRVRRGPALMLVGAGALFATVGLALPASDSRAHERSAHLDRFMPVWQFGERHVIRIQAEPQRVYDAIRQVRADEIFLFRTLTWIRRGGRELTPSILDAGIRESLIDVALQGGFVELADDAPTELVIGAAVVAPPYASGPVLPGLFTAPPPGFALAAMNFRVVAAGTGGSVVTTETRVFASGASTRRRFQVYWRLIYPGSAIIRRMWLRAIARRATS